MPILFKSSKELTLVVRSGKAQNSGYPKVVYLCDYCMSFFFYIYADQSHQTHYFNVMIPPLITDWLK